MTSHHLAMPATAPRPPGGFASTPVPGHDHGAPAGTFAPGTKIQVGSQKVVIQKYFSEGGFAHVYLVKMPKPIGGTDIAVLKRVAVPDKEHLANMRTEVETMKKLKGHRPIVTYYDSHASQLKGGGYEVFLLMEFCNGGGLIDFMNTRLQNRLTEPEILKIFSDVAEGVACMHYLKPPLLHRDLKVENVLITTSEGSRRFKLCDFGSTAPPRPAATSATECRLIEDDVQKHTTLQYRSPEMIDVYRKQPIDEKSDIWALGVLLYKLCYYTTPFEAQGQLAILNASFKFPSYPAFSDRLKKLIASMLKEQPSARPNIYQVLREACVMQGLEVPIKDIYARRTQSETRRNQQLPSPDDVASPPIVGAVYSPPTQQKQAIPDVVPMRRGRPTTGPQAHAAKPSPSPLRVTSNDPFAALDGKPSTVQGGDELSSRFPSLDQFSLLHDGGKFDFDAGSPTMSSSKKDIDQRATEKLADSAFVTPQSRTPVPPSTTAPSSSNVSRAQKIISSNPELQSVTSPPTVVYQPTPTRGPTSSYVSTGTMTSPSPPSAFVFPPPSDRHRSISLPRNQENHGPRSQLLHPDGGQAGSIQSNPSYRPQLGHVRHPSSSRPSLEGGAPNNETPDPVVRAKSSNSQSRPSKTHLDSNIDFLREREASGRRSMDNRGSSENRKSTEPRRSMDTRPSYPIDSPAADLPSEEDTHINSNVDFLRSMEDQETAKKTKRRSTGANHKPKRSSLPSMSLSGTKTLLAGKFGDAFKRFENNASASPPGPRTPSPLQDMERRDLTPIAGSEATDGRSDDGMFVEDNNMTQEQRREMERRRLSMEEKRVADAAAEYRRQVATRGQAPRSIGGVSRATSIQNKVKTLLDESSQHSPVKKTAEGYGRFTEHAPPPQPNQFDQSNPYSKPSVGRKPLLQAVLRGRSGSTQRDNNTYPNPRSEPIPAPSAASKTGGARPNAPPKPMHLNNIHTGPQNSPPKPSSLPPRPVQARPDMSQQEKEDYVADFSKRFPSLSGIEMVEREIEMDGKKRDDARSRSKVV